MEPFTWILIVGLWVARPDPGVVQVKVPMVSQQACEAAAKEMNVTVNKGIESVAWLGSDCKPAK